MSKKVCTFAFENKKEYKNNKHKHTNKAEQMGGWTIIKDCVRVLEDATPKQVYQYFGITDTPPMIEVENKYRQLGYRLMFRM